MGEVIKIDRNSLEAQTKYSRFLEHVPELNLGSLIIIMLCIITMIASTFILIPVGIFNKEIFADTSSMDSLLLVLHSHLYSPQVPLAIFAGALLGSRLGTTSVFLYLGLGLIGLPFFASGGGIGYIFEPTFGFLFGYIIAVYLVGKIFNSKINSFDIVFAATLGVLTIHFFGVIYLITSLYLSGNPMATIKAWVLGLSLSNIPYDILFSIALCSLARPLRGLLWFTTD